MIRVKVMKAGSRRLRPMACVGAAAVLIAVVSSAGCSNRVLEEPRNQAPIATASAAPTSGVAPLAVNFTGSGSDPDGTINRYSWAFGDGSIVQDQNPVHTYQSAGSYTAVLTITDDKGAVGIAQVGVMVAGPGGNLPPTATASANPSSGTAPLAVSFSGSGSDPDGTISSYAWAFGDGGTSSQQNPSHTYQSAGNYTASLTVTDNKGATGSATAAVTVTAPGVNQPPTAAAAANPNYGTAPLMVLFTGSGSDTDGTVSSYAWSFGDGSSSSQQNPTYTYQVAGSYVATLTVTDNQGATGTATAAVTVAAPNANQPPVASASGSPASGKVPLAVSFTGSGTDPDGSIASYAWTFGDGGSSAAQNPAHTYSIAGTYTARLTVTDNQGATGLATVDITAAANQAPTAAASASPTSGTVPLAVNFTGSGSDADGTIASYAWTFGDGGTSALRNPSHTYQTAGNYTARLTVTDNDGATGSATVAITATAASTNHAPVANAGPDQVNLNPGTTVTLSGAGSSDQDGDTLSYQWAQTAGPAVTLAGSNTAAPSFPAPAATTATYTFTLTVTDNGTPPMSAQDSVIVSTRVTYVNTTKALIDARGNQPNGTKLGCTACHMAGGQSPPLTTYTEVYNTRAKTKSKIAVGGTMRKYLLAGEPEIITAWIDNGAPQNNP